MTPQGREQELDELEGARRVPLLSVTVMNYNYARYLDRTIESILRQTFDDYELIFIDNGSTDESLEIIERYAAHDSRIRVVAHSENLGMFTSLHESCALSRGTYRVPIEADDWIVAADAFEAQIDMLERDPSTAFVYSSLTMMGSDGGVYHTSRPYQGDVVLHGAQALEQILSFSLTHTGMMMRMSSVRETPGYEKAYPHIADMMLGVRLCHVGDVGYIDRSLYAFRQHDSNLHSRSPRHIVRHEVLPAIDLAFESPLTADLPDRQAVRRRVTRRGLVHLPTQYIFVGQYRFGWRLYWESAKARPVLTVVQPRTLSLLSRTVLGQRGHETLAGWRERVAMNRGRVPREQEMKSMARTGRPLQRGDVVQVRSAAEILRTLDVEGTLEAMPFMPEMVQYCGRRFTVDRRADKVCDTVRASLQSRHLSDTVLLDDLRCDGSAHGGCQAECRYFWKAAWLRRVGPDEPQALEPRDATAVVELLRRVERCTTRGSDVPVRYRCQATELLRASTPLSTTDPRPYVHALTSGNVTLRTFGRVMARAAVMQPLQHFGRLRIPPLKGPSPTSPPSEPLDLQPGEWVRVKSREEVRLALTDKGMNRGLYFDREMVPFCGKVLQVRGRVERLVDEQTGEMIELSSDCIKLETSVCSGEISTGRWFCPKEVFSYWREAWLERVDEPVTNRDRARDLAAS